VTRVVSTIHWLDARTEAVAVLERAGVLHPRANAEWLLASVLGVDRFAMYIQPTRLLTQRDAERYRELIAHRANRVPLQHLLGFEEFHGMRLAVSPDVLIPRPETEGLVQWAIELLRAEQASLVADVGTGSGAIACALARSVSSVRVLAIERSLPALAVAKANVAAFGLVGRVMVLAGDLLDPVGALRLDAVVANPPYLPTGVLSSLLPEVSSYEPREALDGGGDGLAVIRRIVAAAPVTLRPQGRLVMEIGEDQAGSVASLLAAAGFTDTEARRDLVGRERYITGRLGDTSTRETRRTC
jgi:release factor glutamine methyltransferase